MTSPALLSLLLLLLLLLCAPALLCLEAEPKESAAKQCTSACGIRKQSRIVGGTDTDVNEYPMMAGLVDVTNKELYCGATIISEKYAVTAARCVENRDVTKLGLVVGEHDVTTGKETSATKLYRINKAEMHPDYDLNRNDIAVLEINGTIEMLPACLPFSFADNSFTDQPVTVLGWGLLAFGGTKATKLQQAELTVLSPQRCSEAYEDANSQLQMCAFGPGRGTCQMDSGGPLLWQDSDSGRLYLVGIIGKALECGEENPSINTRVTDFLGWIRSATPGAEYCTA